MIDISADASPQHNRNSEPPGRRLRSGNEETLCGQQQGPADIYDAATFELIKAIDFHSDVDNLRYDAPNQRIYVGYGDDETGAIATLDATTNERLNEEYKLGAHHARAQFSHGVG